MTQNTFYWAVCHSMVLLLILLGIACGITFSYVATTKMDVSTPEQQGVLSIGVVLLLVTPFAITLQLRHCATKFCGTTSSGKPTRSPSQSANALCS